jgi:hypothetical protein
LEDAGIDGRIISKWSFNKWGGEGKGMIDLAEDRDRWQAFLHVVMSLHVP